MHCSHRHSPPPPRCRRINRAITVLQEEGTLEKLESDWIAGLKTACSSLATSDVGLKFDQVAGLWWVGWPGMRVDLGVAPLELPVHYNSVGMHASVGSCWRLLL